LPPIPKEILKMNKFVLLLSALLITISVNAAEPSSQVKTARTTIKSLLDQLVGELKTAMKAGGPEKAIGVCNIKAPEIAAKINAHGNVKVSRVSLKNRNPDNTPSDWQKTVLLDFESRKAAGEEVKKMDYSEVVGDEFRYMKAIPTGIVCLKCHGSEIDSKVIAKLDELYPEDKARGYKQGDIRGAFYVTMPK
jgi:hypothetical protein